MGDNIMRQFKKGVLELIILKLLSQEAMYGYELVSVINNKSSSFDIKEGTLYPILYRLEDDGLVEARWEQADNPSYGQIARGKPKKYYTVTAKGKSVMEQSYELWKLIAGDIFNIMEAKV